MDQTASEAERLSALRELSILRTEYEPHLDAVCRTACHLFAVPMALLLFVDEAAIWFKAQCGVMGDEIAREGAFCDLTIQGQAGRALVFRDLLSDARTIESPLVTGEPHARFYAGVPLSLKSGLNIGTFCIMDTVPRPDFTDARIRQLEDLALIVEAHLRLHQAHVRSEGESAAREKAELATRQSEHRFRLLAETTTDVIILSDLDTRRLYVSPSAEAVLGFPPMELIGTTPLDFVHPDDAEAYERVLNDLTSARINHASTCQRYRHKDGTWLTMEVAQSLARDPVSGLPTGYVTSLRDVTHRKATEDALRLSEERLALALESGGDGLWDWNVTTGKVQLSSHWLSLLGYRSGELAPHISSWQDLVHPDDALRSQKLLFEHFNGLNASYECEYRVRAKDGNYIWTLARGKVVKTTEDRHPARMVGTLIDITHRKESEQRIAFMAHHDALTGLPNRTLFWECLNQEIARAARQRGTFAVFACDLDRFKSVNDSLGHPAGDALLRIVAKRLTSTIREGDTVARLGGDEFAFILRELDASHDVMQMASRIIEAVSQPINLDSHLVTIGASIGIAIGGDDDSDADRIFKHADIALYRAKAGGRNTHRFYEDGMDADVSARNRLENDMRLAIKRGEFHLLYQPIVSLSGGNVIGCEALTRWQHPHRGAISPAEFIPVAEETGLIVSLGAWVLREACLAAASWPDHISVSVNVSGVQFQQSGLEDTIMMALSDSGLAPHRLEIEITESVLMQDFEAVSKTLRRLRNLGVSVALDDFGTGYSSLSYLHKFKFDRLKIDSSFIRQIEKPDAMAIVRAIVGLGRHLETGITAEGVETERQLEYVRNEGCTDVQGFIFGEAISSSALIDFATDKRRLLVA
ncbi:sensor domain-containing phosphodiesterase [Methylobacterium trifolii]|uniref:EAL domain-containing protein n=1 Tax=Methylobacterium trifolii TaxID=1003092 RepID=A0ABQ4U6Z5_9HYPH|nr:EAL domain-containing protein [Methylobacterium trifolii]GJE62182.1 hypothetical protein MPOCJGCO_4312 [Methylobacterium trifolii]